MAENLWAGDGHALAYLVKADEIPHRAEGEAELIAHLPNPSGRVLDVGCGDGRLTAPRGGVRPGRARP